jgi:hypothetical protein
MLAADCRLEFNGCVRLMHRRTGPLISFVQSGARQMGVGYDEGSVQGVRYATVRLNLENFKTDKEMGTQVG